MSIPSTLPNMRFGGPSAPFGDPVPGLASAVSWGAVVAGAAAAAALALILLMLGSGLGLSAVSPWSSAGLNAATLGVTAIAWVAATQIIASAMGGYLAGRLRTKWPDVHHDEVYFRDTAHGFLSWAVAALATAALLASAVGSIVGTGVQAGATVASNVSAEPLGYAVDSLLLRSPGATTTDATHTADSAEVTRIFVHAGAAATLPMQDVQYLGQRVAQRSGLAAPEAEARVQSTFTALQTQVQTAQAQAKDAADRLRKAAAYSTLWLFVALLAGAFAASLAATFGGRQRDL